MTDTVGIEAMIGATRLHRGVLWHARRHPTVAVGLVILLTIIIATLAAPLLSEHDPLAVDSMARFKPPSWEHVLGTDGVGRDLWSRTVHGGRVSLVVGLTVSILATGIGLLIGLVSGYNRIADAILSRDYPVIQGVLLIFSATYVIVNLIIDLLYVVIDPRIRY